MSADVAYRAIVIPDYPDLALGARFVSVVVLAARMRAMRPRIAVPAAPGEDREVLCVALDELATGSQLAEGSAVDHRLCSLAVLAGSGTRLRTTVHLQLVRPTVRP